MRRKLIFLPLAFCIINSVICSSYAADYSTANALSLSESGVKLIESFEGFSPSLYTVASQTYIGYGTKCGSGDYPNGISKENAEKLLLEQTDICEASINGFIDNNNIELTQYQFDALISLTYNLGTGWMETPCKIKSYLVSGIYSDIQFVNAIGIWCHIGKEINSHLIERRLTEARLFLYGSYGGDTTHKFSYLIFDACGGSVEDDIAFFEYGKPYGEIQEAELNGSTFWGWYTQGGEEISSDLIAEDNLTVLASWTERTETALYTDVKRSDWFYTYVKDLNKNNIISGYTDGSFKPQNTVTCGEALKLILLAAGNGPFSPTKAHWASGYLDYAVFQGLVNEADIPDLDAPINRLLIAQLAAKALMLEPSVNSTPFADTSDGYVLSLYELSIVEGSSVNGVLLFNPDNLISRSEISAIIWRISNVDFGAY